MCSIAGSKDSALVSAMLNKMLHRSPDGTKVVDLQNFSIGMGRLAIIDLESSDLFPYQEDGYVLSFNGEIYNYRELRIALERSGFSFRTKSDTEVLLKAYRKWDVKCLNKFNGMFAFAIYDPYKKRIFFARDIAGEKPLYYNVQPFEFASEAKALNFNCTELTPAFYGIYDLQSEQVSLKKYWDPEKIDIDPDTASEELEALLKDSILLRTRVDVPYGLYLSGGVDSTLISTFHDFENIFTFNDGNYKEEYLRIAKDILYHLDYPITSFSPFGLWKLAEMASKKVKVVLSGEGADELFGGYIRYVQPHFNFLAQKEFPSYKTMFGNAQSVTAAGWSEFNGNLRDLLRMGDRMTSAFGIENRCPFLDKRIINFAFSLPDNLKIDGLKTKVILNNILERRLPYYRKIEKAGLYCSVNKWLGCESPFDKTEYMAFQNKLWKNLV